MTKEEKQKAINALKISVPIKALTQEKFNDYIQTLNKVMDWLEQEPCEDATLKDIFCMGCEYKEPRWIPMVRREPTDEEKAEHLAKTGEELGYMLENEMPLTGQEVLVSIGELVTEDVFDEDFFNFEINDIENVDAWMPLPQPYRG